MNDFEYLLYEVFGKPTPEDPNAKRANELLNQMEDINIGSVDKIDQKKKESIFQGISLHT